MKLSIILIAFLFHNMNQAISQDKIESDLKLEPRNSTGALGLVSIQFNKRTFNFSKISQLQDGSSLVGISSLGIRPSKNSQTRIIPFNFEVYLNDDQATQLYDYDIALIGSGFADKVNNYFSHQLDLSFLHFDRKNFRENGAPVTIDRFKIFDAKYQAMIHVAPRIIKLVFSAKFAPFQSSRESILPEDIKLDLTRVTNNHLDFFGNNPNDEQSFIKKAYGSGMELHKNKLNERSLINSFLGDSEFALGIELFNFIDTRLAIAFDSTQSFTDQGHGSIANLSNITKSIETQVSFKKIIPKVAALRNVSFFAKFNREKSNLMVQTDIIESTNGPLDKIVLDKNYENTTGTVGLRWNFTNWKK